MTSRRRFMTTALMLTGLTWTGTAAAGSLTPPGAPGSTMHTLTEVHDRAQAAQTAAEASEPRTAISEATTIAEPGSYYLAGNITGQITIQADNVTLDLMGFRIEHPAGSAIVIPNGHGNNAFIRDGMLRPGIGFIGLDARYSDNCRFEDLRVEGSGATYGIYARHYSLVRNCIVSGCQNYGIYVGNSTEIRDCRVASGSDRGIRAGSWCRIEGNRVENHGGIGIQVGGAGTVLAGNTVRNNNPDFALHAETTQIPSIDEMYAQLLAIQQEVAVVKLRQGASGMAETVGGMVLIPAGSFRMGDAFTEGFTDERSVHTVTVSAFYMDQYEVTKALWDEVYTWASTNGYTFENVGEGKGNSHPVNMINWYDCVKWANARSQRDGLTPVYYTTLDHTTVYQTGNTLPYPDWSANGYRLPTEAEWEKAARGGVEGRRFPWADGNTTSHTRANYDANPSVDDFDVSSTTGYHPDYSGGTPPHTSPVGSFAPNGYGLYDMMGNIWEWCWDMYRDDYYSSSPPVDPRGPGSSPSRVARGGHWYSWANYCRVAKRDGYMPALRSNFLGLRLVRRAP